MKIDARRPRHLLLLLQQWIYTWTATLLRPLGRNRPRPLILLYGHQFSGNLRALYEEWENHRQADLDLYFLTLDPDQAKRLSAQGIRVLRCNRLGDMMMLAGASALVSDHGLHMMSPLLRFTDIRFIDVWHGIPFKGFVPADFKLQHRYQEVWVSSPLLKNLYVDRFGFDAARVRNLGYARTDKLFRAEKPDSDFRTMASISADSQIVLYAPTWQQDDSGRELFPFGESQASFLQRLDDICKKRGATLVVRSHLNAQIGSRTFENVRYCSMRDYPDSEDLLASTDILVCDWSSIAFDYLALNRPTLFLDVEPPFANGFSLDRQYRFGKVIGDMEGLANCLDETLQNPGSYMATCGAKHQSITEAVYGKNTDGQVASRQLDRLIAMLGVVKAG